MIKWICQLINKDDTSATTFYDSSDKENYSGSNALLSGVIKKEVSDPGSFEFEIHKENDYRTKFHMMLTKVLVYGINTDFDNQIVSNFLGRVSKIDVGFYGVLKITVEGAMGVLDDYKDYLRLQNNSFKSTEKGNNYSLENALFKKSLSLDDDGLVYQINGTTERLFKFNNSNGTVLYTTTESDWNNQDLDNYKRCILAVDDATTEYDIGWSNEATTLDSLEDYIDDHGGYVIIEPVKTASITAMLKLLWFPEYSDPPKALQEKQELKLGENILSLSKNIDNTHLFSRLYPLGTTGYWTTNSAGEWVELDTSELSSDYNFEPFPRPYEGQYIDIADGDAIEHYGLIDRTVIFENANTQAKLQKQAKRYIKQNFSGGYNINVSAVDLAIAGEETYAWHIGHYVKIISSYHGYDDGVWCMISAIEVNMFDASKTKITFTDRPSRYTKKVKNQLKKASTKTQTNKSQTDVTTTDLYTKTNANTSAISTKQDTLTAGTGIKISGSTISTDLESGTGIAISGAKISTDLESGTGIAISGAKISTDLESGTGIAISGAKISTDLSAGKGISLSGATIATNLKAGTGISLSGTTQLTIAANIKSTSHDSVKVNNIIYYASESEYEALETKVANTLYLIKES